jgi:tRNA(Arg) A34 adenosine deaminase TadA
MSMSLPKTHSVRVMAGLVYKGELITCSSNSKKTDPFQNRFCPHPDALFLHAETRVIKRALKVCNMSFSEIQKATLYVSRIVLGNAERKFSNNQFQWGLAKPCPGCQAAINFFEIKKVFYTTSVTNSYERF